MSTNNFPRQLSYSRVLFALIVGVVIGFFVALLFLDSETITDSASTEPMHIHRSIEVLVNDTLYSRVRIACVVMTRPETHDSKAKHIKATWGKHCNKFLLFSTNNATVNNSVGAIRTPAPDGRKFLWQKAKGAFMYTYNNHFDDYDWFYKADDDTFAIMENMRRMLSFYDASQPLAFGYKFVLPKKKYIYFSGGPGYVMSKAALKSFIEKGIVGKACYSGNDGNEDINVGRCLGLVGVNLIHSIDENGKPNFSVFGPGTILFGTSVPKWFYNYSPVAPSVGPDCCPEFPLAFHYIKPQDLYTLYYFLYQAKIYKEPPQEIKSSDDVIDIDNTTDSTTVATTTMSVKKRLVTLKVN